MIAHHASFHHEYTESWNDRQNALAILNNPLAPVMEAQK
jgi:hypothetical protein